MASPVGMLSWWSRRQWRRGFDEAAGRLLRGEWTPEEVWLETISGSPRDHGAMAALTALTTAGAIRPLWSAQRGPREEWMDGVC